MGVVAQVIGVVLIAAGCALLWSPWALVAGGAVLLVVPEIAGVVRRP